MESVWFDKCTKLIFLILLNSVKEVANSKKSQKKFTIVTEYKKWVFTSASSSEQKKWVKEIKSVLNGDISSNKEKTFNIDDFELLKLVGKGAFGKVYQVRKKNTGDIFALKMLFKKYIVDNNEVIHTIMERNVLAKSNNPFVIKLYYAFQNVDKLFFVMEFALGGDLFYHLRKSKVFDEQTAKFYAAEVTLGLQYLHEIGVIYRDLKPENILLDSSGHILITDFGLCKEDMLNSKTSTVVGTPEYVSPEIIENMEYDFAVDWWSVGILIYEMLVGETPFFSNNHSILFNKIRNAKPYIPDNLSKEVGDLINSLLIKNPQGRLKDPEEIKRHPWFKDIDFELLSKKQIEPPLRPAMGNLENFSPLLTSTDIVKDLSEGGGDVDDEVFENFAFSRPSFLGV